MAAETTDYWTLPDSGDCPWIHREYSYAGWVPNVSGHLSFNLVDPHSGLPTYNYQPDLTSPRLIALHRERLAQDYPFPDWLMRRIRPSARQDFILLAQSCTARTPLFDGDTPRTIEDQNGVLTGVVAVLPSERGKKTRKLRKRLLRGVDESITDSISNYASGDADAERVTETLLNQIQQVRDKVACYLLRFALFRTGELRIWFDLGEFLGRDLDVAPASPEEREAASPIAPQVYYFIKDMLHAHYHHHKKSDQLLPLTRLSSAPHSVRDDETAWRYATLRGLVRVVVELRQGRSLDGHKRAIGIIAYAKAFQCVLGRITRNRWVKGGFEHSPKIMPYDFSNLVSSIEAIDASVQSAVTAKLQLFAIVIGIILSGLALWAGAVQVHPVLCDALQSTSACQEITAGPSVTALNWVIANPMAFLTLLVIVGFAAFVIFFRGTGAIPFAERLIHWSERLAEAIAVDISRKTQRSDGLGFFVGLMAMLVPIGLVGTIAYWLLPTRDVTVVKALDPDQRGKWDTLSRFAGVRISESGLLLSSPISPQLRAKLSDTFADFVRLVGDDAILKAEDRFLYLVPEKAKPGADAAYLIIDRSSDRFEAGIRVAGRNQIYRTSGVTLPRPLAVRHLLGNSPTDIISVGAATSSCQIEQSGESNRVIVLSGELLANDYCDYNLTLSESQSLSFNRKGSRGLRVDVRQGSKSFEIDPVFRPSKGGDIKVQVRWDGWQPTKTEALRPRKFYVRLEMH